VTLVKMVQAIVAALVLTTVTAKASTLPACNDPEVQNVLVRATRAMKVQLPPHEISSDKSEVRWCETTLHIPCRRVACIGWWYEQTTYTVEFINEREGTFWVQVRSSYLCNLAQTEIQKLILQRSRQSVCQ